ncbi:MAG: hypothetical protein EZS28_028241 [Streblomastix strix]|uniref:Uncharacterized protein n=1 Tax=Streblomastix strix TaxID=222440 RepID=A0A5J4V193_9EUKA|nr:MAG: hypothetical protein EZS28_028241 [Streblomastix strix]
MNSRNRKFKRLVDVVQDCWMEAQDCLSVSWLMETQYIHPTILLIWTILQKIESDGVKAFLIVPYWPVQPWWLDHVRVMSKYMIFGKSQDVLKTGERMRKLKNHLHLGKMMALLKEATEVMNYSKVHQVVEISLNLAL